MLFGKKHDKLIIIGGDALHDHIFMFDFKRKQALMFYNIMPDPIFWLGHANLSHLNYLISSDFKMNEVISTY